MEIKNKLHGNAKGKRYALNYKVVAAMQQMGCGSSNMGTLSGFLDLPSKADTVSYHLKHAEQILGTSQLELKEKSKIEAVSVEIVEMGKHEAIKYHACDITGHVHEPLPMLKGSYGKS